MYPHYHCLYEEPNVTDHEDLEARMWWNLFYQDVSTVIFPTYYKSCTPSQLETQDSCTAANQNTFWDWIGPIITFPLSSNVQLLTVLAKPHPDCQSSSKTLTILATPWLCQTLEISAHWRKTPRSCRSLWWGRQHAPCLTAASIPGETITRDGLQIFYTDTEKMQKVTEKRCEAELVKKKVL